MSITVVLAALKSSIFDFYFYAVVSFRQCAELSTINVDHSYQKKKTTSLTRAVLQFVHKEVVHGARCEQAATAAAASSSSGGEVKKTVSWGSVKTHKVYVTELDSDHDGGVSSNIAPRTTRRFSYSYGEIECCWRRGRHACRFDARHAYRIEKIVC